MFGVQYIVKNCFFINFMLNSLCFSGCFVKQVITEECNVEEWECQIINKLRDKGADSFFCFSSKCRTERGGDDDYYTDVYVYILQGECFKLTISHECTASMYSGVKSTTRHESVKITSDEYLASITSKVGDRSVVEAASS